MELEATLFMNGPLHTILIPRDIQNPDGLQPKYFKIIFWEPQFQKIL